MAFTSLDDIAIGLIQGREFGFAKASLTAQVANEYASLWRATSVPAQGAIPTTAAICNAALLGAIPLAPRTGGQERVIAAAEIALSAGNATLYVEDRLAHMGGLVGNVTTAQTVGIDLDANLGVSNLAERIGAPDYSEVEWYLEWYTATGATVSTPTAQVTYHDGTTGSVNIFTGAGATALPASVGASRRYEIVPTNGKFIRSIQTVALSASTGTAGNFGVTAVRSKMPWTAIVANRVDPLDWSMTRAAKVADNACLGFAMRCSTTSTGTAIGVLKQAVR